jgi:hypothetical protein
VIFTFEKYTFEEVRPSPFALLPNSGKKASVLRTFAQIAFGNFFYPQPLGAMRSSRIGGENKGF